MLVYEVNVAAPTDSDVVTRKMRIMVNGKDGGSAEVPGDTIRFGGLKFNEGDEVELHLVDVDDAGNESPPAVCKFKAHDTIAPGIPGGFGVSLTDEVPDVAAPIVPATHVTAHSKTDGKSDGGDKVGPAASKTDGKSDGGDKVGPEGGDDLETGEPDAYRGRKE